MKIPSLRQHLPAILAYPTRPEVFGLIAVYSVARLISYLLGSAISIQWLPNFVISGDAASISRTLLGFFVDLMILILSLKLAVEALLNTAKDRLDPDKAGPEWASDNSAAGQFFLLLFFFVPTYLLALFFGASLGWLALCAVLLALPAAIIVHAMDENLWHALNPLAWWPLFERLGGAAYLTVVALIGLLAALAFGLQATIFAQLPEWLGAIFSRFVSVYALVVAYHLMGYLLYQHHEQLGLDVAPPIVRPQLANIEEDRCMREAEALVADDKPKEAAEVLRALIHRHGASAPIHDRYRQLLLGENELAALSQHGREYVAVLLALHQEKRALALYVESRALDPDFQLDVPEDITQLISHAVATGQSKQAVELATDFDTRFPRNADVPQNMLAAAKLMAERLGREAEARRLLSGLLARYPEHPLTPEINATLIEIERVLISAGSPRHRV
jgi:hypothetical protein